MVCISRNKAVAQAKLCYKIRIIGLIRLIELIGLKAHNLMITDIMEARRFVGPFF